MKKHVFLLLLLSAMSPVLVSAQGLILDDEAYRRIPLAPGAMTTTLRFGENELAVVSLRKYCPMPLDQGNSHSCVAHALSHALSIEWAINGGYPGAVFSPDYIYNQTFERNGAACTKAGSKFSNALDLLHNNGDCLINDFRPTDCSVQPNTTHHSRARNFPLADFNKVFELGASDINRINTVKEALTANHPVVVGFNVTDDLKSDIKIWGGNGTATNGLKHAMVVVGFNNPLRQFELLNSWGPNAHNGGYLMMPFEAFGRLVEEAYMLNVSPNSRQTADLTRRFGGYFGFQYPSSYNHSTQKFDFTEAGLRFNEKTRQYETNEYWNVGQMFQLTLKNTQPNEYLYVFSLNPQNQLNYHFPQFSPIDQNQALAPGQFAVYGMNNERLANLVSPWTAPAGVETIIPSEDKALSLTDPGDDYLIALYSTRAIDDFNAVAQKVKNSHGPIMTRIEQALGSRMVPTADVIYRSDAMEFEAYAKSGHVAVVVLKVTAR